MPRDFVKTLLKFLVAARNLRGPFTGVEDLARRVPSLSRKDMVQLARIGAINNVDRVAHRRDALWQVEQAGRPVGPLLQQAASVPQVAASSPLKKMSTEERIVADYSGTGLTTGPHPISYMRSRLKRQNILSASELARMPNGVTVRAAGCIIARQRPGTASGFVFLSMEDETGISNIIVHPDLYERERILVSRGKFLLIEGKLQNEDTVVHIRAERVLPLAVTAAKIESHDFY